MNVLQWLVLEKRLLNAQSTDEFPYIFLSILQKLLQCQISLSYKKRLNSHVVMDVSYVSEVDRQSPIIEWVEKQVLPSLKAEVEVTSITAPENMISSDHLLHLPISSNGELIWGVICFIDKVPSANEMMFFKQLGDHIGTLYQKLAINKQKLSHHAVSKKRIILLFLLTFVAGFIKLPQTVLASAEIMPINPELISPSIDGVIKQVLVLPNEVIKKGQALIELDDILIKNKLEEATQKLNTKKSRYLKAYRNAYSSVEARSELLTLENEVKKAEIEKVHYTNLLKRTKLLASSDGVALFSSPTKLIGKPVKIGEKIMLVADPNKTKIDFWIPVDSIVTINESKDLVLYPNLHPLSTVDAKVQYTNPIAEAMPDGSLGFFGQAEIIKGNIQLGEKGTLKLYGAAKPIWQLIFQRPFRFIRQTLGI